jgi:hypothetical protein
VRGKPIARRPHHGLLQLPALAAEVGHRLPHPGVDAADLGIELHADFALLRFGLFQLFTGGLEAVAPGLELRLGAAFGGLCLASEPLAKPLQA